jgi:hypothetical protein
MAFQVTDVQKALKGADYPADGDALAEVARGNGADDDLVQAIAGLEGEQTGPDDVMKGFKGQVTGRQD